MHISWDTAGCLCPVGDFFNYAPPEEDPHQLGESKAADIDSFLRITSANEGEKADNSTEELADAKASRLTDAGYDEALASYCFHAKKNYERGDQVLIIYSFHLISLVHAFCFHMKTNYAFCASSSTICASSSTIYASSLPYLVDCFFNL